MKKLHAEKKEVFLVFPHQLFAFHPVLSKKNMGVYLVEESTFFTRYRFHKQKLVLHRASMKAYADYLKKKKCKVFYLDFFQIPKTEKLFAWLDQDSVEILHVIDPVDSFLKKKIEQLSKRYKMRLVWYESLSFLTPEEIISQYFKRKNNFSMGAFYQMQRKRLNILMTASGKPVGGKWSYDAQNREKIPKNVTIPPLPKIVQNNYAKEAITYVEKHFSENYGTLDTCMYPINFQQAHQWFHDFLEHRLKFFGTYQDAIISDEPFLFHSILSPILNCGLLTPQEAVQKTLAWAQKKHVPINSLEGFIRQIIGWREFVRGVYIAVGDVERKKNFWKHNRKLTKAFWKPGSLGIEPLDATIKKVFDYAYCHHIERLMVLGNFMLLAEYHPDDVYDWFMELFIDAYDWVMVPNVYGMSLYADGGMMSTKPYISSSNYLLKMSDFKKTDWVDLWDALYWTFILKHQAFFRKNYRLSMMVKIALNFSDEKIKKFEKLKRDFLKH